MDSQGGAGSVGESAGFCDRSNGLVGFGVALIAMGILELLMEGMTAILPIIMGVGSARLMMGMAMFSVPLVVAKIWLGIGSVNAERWARALILVLAWISLYDSSRMVVFWLTRPDEFVKVTWMAGTLSVATCLISGLYAWYYRSQDVQRTCEKRHPALAWTDRVPLPVLGASVYLACQIVAPIGLREGHGAWAAGALVMAGQAACAWGLYRLYRWAWWGTLGVQLVFWSSRYWLRLLTGAEFRFNRVNLVILVVWSAIAIAYLIFIRRYFREEAVTMTITKQV
ncbi:MAG: hypothetical protein WC859_05775 [Elusimicrobiota bacterium]|jgi:hypothetical protein